MSRFLLAFALTTLAASAQAADNGFYLGASVGAASVENVVDDFDFDDDDMGWKAFAGFRFSNWLGAEASYIDFGEPSDTILGEDVVGEADALDIFAVGFLPVGPFDLFAKAGLVTWDADFDIDDLDISADDDGTDFAYGAGAQFRLGSAAIRAEYEKFEILDDADMWSLGVSWTFF